MVEPISAAIVGGCYAIGVALGRKRNDPKGGDERTAKKDKQLRRVMPASFDQMMDLDTLAAVAASKSGRDKDIILAQYGVYTMRGGGRTMTRKQLKMVEADQVIAQLRKDFDISLDPDRSDWDKPRDTGLRPGEEPF